MTEFEYLAGRISADRFRLASIPAIENVAVAGHFDDGFHRNRIRLNELGSDIGGAFSVLVEDEPVAFRRDHGQFDIAVDGNVRIIRDQSFFRKTFRFDDIV